MHQRTRTRRSIAATVSEANAREIVVETTKVKAVFSNRGATIVHWILKDAAPTAGEPLDLVPGGAGADAIKPFTLTVDDQAISARLKDAIYRVTVNGAPAGEMVDATASPQTDRVRDGVRRRLQRQEDVQRRADELHRRRSARMSQMGGQRLNPVIHWGPGLGDDIARAKPASFFSPSYNTPAQAIVHKDGKVERIAATATASQEGPFRYAGIDDHYFVSMLLNEQNTQAGARRLRAESRARRPTIPSIIGRYVDYSVRFQAPQDQSRFFFGPKAFDDAARDRARSDAASSTSASSRGSRCRCSSALKWVHGFIGNWGWAIIVLTLLDQHRVVPAAPQERGLDAQDAGDPAADEGDPGSLREVQGHRSRAAEDEHRGDGALQGQGRQPGQRLRPDAAHVPVPVRVLRRCCRSRSRSAARTSCGWIHNLSAPDPFYILPIVMGVAQFWQTKMTPCDRRSRRSSSIMMFMPLMFSGDVAVVPERPRDLLARSARCSRSASSISPTI